MTTTYNDPDSNDNDNVTKSEPLGLVSVKNQCKKSYRWFSRLCLTPWKICMNPQKKGGLVQMMFLFDWVILLGEPVVNFLGCIWDKNQPLGFSGSRPEGLHCYSDTSGVGQGCQSAGISHGFITNFGKLAAIGILEIFPSKWPKKEIQPWNLTARPWKKVVGRLLSYWFQMVFRISPKIF